LAIFIEELSLGQTLPPKAEYDGKGGVLWRNRKMVV
jgi:hypothetical protein